MPQQRRVMTCQSCRRLKTRCEVPPGSGSCVRCRNLRLDCVLPFASASDQILQSPENFEARDESSFHQHPPNCSDRLAAVEASLLEIQRTLQLLVSVHQQPPTTSAAAGLTKLAQPVQPTPISDRTAGEGHVLQASRDISIAPVQEVRKMNSWITGVIVPDEDGGVWDEITRLGSHSEDLENRLIEGFKKMSPRLHFIHSHIASDPSQRHRFLFLTCMVAGIPTVPPEYTTNLHPGLYKVLRETLGKAMLNTPLGLPIIYSMLITSTWNLTPRLQGRYIDSWLLSGSTVLHSMLFLDLLNPGYMLDLDDIASRHRILAWNATCLLHFKFSVGTGKLSIIQPHHMERFIVAVKEDTRFTEPDRKVVAELQLYILLYKAVIQNSISKEEVRLELDTWRRDNFMEDDLGLSFGFSAASLVLDRWELAQIYQSASAAARSGIDEPLDGRLERAISSILHHCHLIIEKMGIYATSFGTIQTYDFLLGAYAAITLVEYSDYLPNVEATFQLVQEVHIGWQRAGDEPVFTWAKNMMSKRAADKGKETAASQHRSQEKPPGSETWWAPFDLLNSALPCDDVDLWPSMDE